MTHREQLAILALILVLVILAILFSRPAASDAPVVAGVVPAGEFVPVSTFRVAPSASGVSALQADVATDGRSLGATRSAEPFPSPSASKRVPTPTPVVKPSRIRSPGDTSMTGISGVASWFASPRGVSAAGPALRTALGPGWRGMRVRVTGPAGSADVVLGDWMRADRLIDLDDDVFPAVCGPLSKGICKVEVAK